MKKSTFRVVGKASLSLSSLVDRRSRKLHASSASRAIGFSASVRNEIHESDQVALLVETTDARGLRENLGGFSNDRIEAIAEGFLSARVGSSAVDKLLASEKATRIQTKKRKRAHLQEVLPDVRVASVPAGPRTIAETGRGVLIGVIDSGFDLSHPAFRDAQGGLRVDALLDQQDNDREFDTQTLEQRWASGTGPGADDDGHGTHVASIAGGSRFLQYEGVAPEARFLLVRTNFRDTDEALSWIFGKAQSTPCVINMSLGHHFGAHDGTDSEERLQRTLIGPGRAIVVSAGNERTDDIHIGGRFVSGQAAEAPFRIFRQRQDEPEVSITLWHDDSDQFDVSLLTPGGQELPVPALGQGDRYTSSLVDIELARRAYQWSHLTQVQIEIGFRLIDVPDSRLAGWRLKVVCRNAVIGRWDAWFSNSGYAQFGASTVLEAAGTVGIPATGDGCLSIASHVTRTSWVADAGSLTDSSAVAGRSSSFSSLGPVRDGRQKPDFSAPGQYVTAALADRSAMASFDERALSPSRLLTIEGTSMASPAVAGIVALLFQKKPNLTTEQVRDVLRQSARRDAHTGFAGWDPAYGYGKVDVAAALARV